MNRPTSIIELLLPLSQDSSLQLLKFLKFSEARFGTPAKAETALLESLSLQHNLNGRPN